MKSLILRYAVLGTLLTCLTSPSASAQQKRLPEGTPLPDYAKVYPVPEDRGPVITSRNGLPNIMVMGYWPPTNEMLRPFSTNLEQNPGGWVGEDWEGRGYNIYSFFPEFPGELGKGEGDFEVDYQDTSADFWDIVAQVGPIAIVTTGRADDDFDWELEGGHHMYPLAMWTHDYLDPFVPTPDLPIADEPAGNERWSTLPIQAIVDAVEAQVPALYAYGTALDDSRFLCNFVGYHANWYHDMHADPNDPLWVVAAGHIHVGSAMDLADAVEATEITLRTLTGYLDAQLTVAAPAPEPGGSACAPELTFCFGGTNDGNACATDDDCPDSGRCWTDCWGAWRGADCVAGTCYIPKHRYLSIDPTVNALPVSYQVEIFEAADYPDAVGRTWWVDEPQCYDYPDGNVVTPKPETCAGFGRFGWVSALTSTLVERVWTETPIHISECGIAPAVVYSIRASDDGGVFFSAPLIINTIHDPLGLAQSWGDIAAGPVEGAPGSWYPPEGAGNLGDVGMAIRTFENRSDEVGFPPHVWVDVEIDRVVNFGDIQFLIKAFEGVDYASIDLPLIGADPAGCP